MSNLSRLASSLLEESTFEINKSYVRYDSMMEDTFVEEGTVCVCLVQRGLYKYDNGWKFVQTLPGNSKFLYVKNKKNDLFDEDEWRRARQ